MKRLVLTLSLVLCTDAPLLAYSEYITGDETAVDYIRNVHEGRLIEQEIVDTMSMEFTQVYARKLAESSAKGNEGSASRTVEEIWKQYALRKPYNSEVLGTRPLDPAYSTALNSKNSRPVVVNGLTGKPMASSAAQSSSKPEAKNSPVNAKDSVSSSSSSAVMNKPIASSPSELKNNNGPASSASSSAIASTSSSIRANGTATLSPTANQNQNSPRVLREPNNTPEALQRIMEQEQAQAEKLAAEIASAEKKFKAPLKANATVTSNVTAQDKSYFVPQPPVVATTTESTPESLIVPAPIQQNAKPLPQVPYEEIPQ